MLKPLSGHRACALLTLALCAMAPVTAQAASCPIPQVTDIPPPADNGGQTLMTSDTAQVEDNGASRLQGNVRLERGASSLHADELYFNPNTGFAEVSGNAQFRTPTLQVRAKSARINMDKEEGEFVGTQFAMTDTGGRGEAQRLSSEAGIITLEGSHYTTCPANDEFWLLRADRIALNTHTGWGEAWDSKIRVLDTTVFYLPYIWFPIDDRRQSGFLPPSIGSSDDTGFDASIPYYINLAPNYDATIIPRYMSDRGPQINAEFRYLTHASYGEVGVEYLHKDKQTDERRDLQLFQHQGRVTDKTALHVDYTRVSDREYFREIDNTLEAGSRDYLDQRLLLSWYPSNWFSADILTSRFQTIKRTITRNERPYRRMPRIRANLETPQLYGLRFDMDTEFTRFTHDNDQLVNGWRYVANPSVELAMDNGAAWFTNRLGMHYTSYALDNVGPGADENPDRSIPTFSSDMGLRFERLMDNGGLHLLEPRLYYLYVDYKRQKDLPIFDAGDPDFRFDRLFATNRFLGNDRIADAHHVALAWTNRWLDPLSGQEKTRLSIGQILRLDSPEVSLPNTVEPNPNESEIATELAHNFTRNWSSALMLLWDNDKEELSRGSARLRYFDAQERLFAVAYRYRDNILEQTDLSFAWPLNEEWNVIGRWNHSLEFDRNIESFLGVEYTDCCWGVRVVARRNLDGNRLQTEARQETGIYLELNLLGLGRFGDNFDSTLERDTLRSVYE